ncbi:hypothetical protein CRENPOLYSF2_1920006 [Crenothrix polyspora]|jgi:hypothetical protein|uniref:Uncharacterized protein n=1 Tax=Crenothrix polyspora TaxID=360316 RepID=A0A1R4H3T2_9GAMM|nr:hypothetical protein CRENPOLYSF2_1920006 [Crenothrix polyspora]
MVALCNSDNLQTFFHEDDYFCPRKIQKAPKKILLHYAKTRVYRESFLCVLCFPWTNKKSANTYRMASILNTDTAKL